MMQSDQTLRTPPDSIPADIISAGDYERLAPRFIPADRLAYIAGGSGHDVTVHNNEKAFSEFAIIPRSLRDVSQGSTRLEFLNTSFNHPVFLAPVAYQTLVHPQGELATAQGAEATDTCMIASTLSSASLEQIAAHTGAHRWFQLYLQPRDGDSFALIQRAVGVGYQAIVLTVDAAIQAPSIRAIRAGFQFPAAITPANLQYRQPAEAPKAGADQSHIFIAYMQNAPTVERVRKLIEASPVPVLIKGVISPDDARVYKALGAAGIIVSNHGGRTLDGVPASLSVLPAIRHALGDEYPLMLDSGIRSGSDIFKAIALGADAVLIGRLQVYALSIAGALGVAHMLKLLRQELELCMAITGCASLADIKRSELFRI